MAVKEGEKTRCVVGGDVSGQEASYEEGVRPEWVDLRRAFSRVLAWKENRFEVPREERKGVFEIGWRPSGQEYAPSKDELEAILARASMHRQHGISYVGELEPKNLGPINMGEWAIAEAHFELMLRLQQDLKSKGLFQVGDRTVRYPSMKGSTEISENVWREDGHTEVDGKIWPHAVLPDYSESLLDMGFSHFSGDSQYYCDIKVKLSYVENAFSIIANPDKEISVSKRRVIIKFSGKSVAFHRSKGAIIVAILMKNAGSSINSILLNSASDILRKEGCDLDHCLDKAKLRAETLFDDKVLSESRAANLIQKNIDAFEEKSSRMHNEFHDHIWISRHKKLIEREGHGFSYQGNDGSWVFS